MSDINTTVVDIDRGMDCFDEVQFKTTDFIHMIKHDVTELGEEISYKLRRLNDDLDELYDAFENAKQNNRDTSEIKEKITEIKARIEKVQLLMAKQLNLSSNFRDESEQLAATIQDQTTKGNREMANYLMGIQKIKSPNEKANVVSVPVSKDGNGEYFVVFVDSRKYPQSAEHIKACFQMGYSNILTLNRDGVDENRKTSLHKIPPRHEWDRDEFPPAAFLEGGLGAHIAYILASDNRGFGSSFRHQLSNAHNGAKVRFRII